MTKAESNRKNALKSTGPKTPSGKGYSRYNARKHGFYSRELLVSKADEPEFDQMRAGLLAQLEPSTTFQWLAFDYNVVCQWRVKLALRLERPQFARQFQEDSSTSEETKAPDAVPVIRRWYGCSRAEIRQGIRGLEFALSEFDQLGHFKEETKAFLTTGFGADFVPMLEEWITMSKDAILLADHLVSHAAKFPNLPHLNGKPSSLEETRKVVIDPMQRRHMVIKLLGERRTFLEEHLFMRGQRTPDGTTFAAQTAAFNPRFLADATRDSRLALDYYFDLIDRGL